jgi:DNA (cytosine-5)-methyltransferase 1
MRAKSKKIRAAEFFAGAGLVRMALEGAGCEVVFANDISEKKKSLYTANFLDLDFRLCDIRELKGDDIPKVDIATASFPCTDLSLAGNRLGLKGKESGLLLDFLRVVREMGDRRPKIIMTENVSGFASSRGGEDLRLAVSALNKLGYFCDIIRVDARNFLPQSRPRIFIVGSIEKMSTNGGWLKSDLRPSWVLDLHRKHPDLLMQAAPLPKLPQQNGLSLADVVERFSVGDKIWWDNAKLNSFWKSLSDIQAARLKTLRQSSRLTWATAYRRTRLGKPVWEVRSDKISGCLRTTRGGSSKQALVEAGRGSLRVRWMTAREYARLQGAPDMLFGEASESQARFALGDAVCVPAVEWIARHYLVPMVRGESLSAQH